MYIPSFFGGCRWMQGFGVHVMTAICRVTVLLCMAVFRQCIMDGAVLWLAVHAVYVVM